METFFLYLLESFTCKNVGRIYNIFMFLAIRILNETVQRNILLGLFSTEEMRFKGITSQRGKADPNTAFAFHSQVTWLEVGRDHVEYARVLRNLPPLWWYEYFNIQLARMILFRINSPSHLSSYSGLLSKDRYICLVH